MKNLSKKQITKIDALAVKNGIQVRQMMELAGWHILDVFKQLRISKTKKILVVSGVGNNGGDALCAARHLYNNGYKINILLAQAKLHEDAFHQLSILRKMKVPIKIFSKKFDFTKFDVIIDGLLGYNISMNPKEPFKSIILGVNDSKARVISYDLPSGLHATTGKAYEPCIFADATLTLHMPKIGLTTREGKKIAGRIFIGDLGIPEILYKGKI